LNVASLLGREVSDGKNGSECTDQHESLPLVQAVLAVVRDDEFRQRFATVRAVAHGQQIPTCDVLTAARACADAMARARSANAVNVASWASAA
jgi:hypothetical protein